MGGFGLDGMRPRGLLTTHPGPPGPQTQLPPPHPRSGPDLVAAKKGSLPSVLTHDINLSPRMELGRLPMVEAAGSSSGTGEGGGGLRASVTRTSRRPQVWTKSPRGSLSQSPSQPRALVPARTRDQPCCEEKEEETHPFTRREGHPLGLVPAPPASKGLCNTRASCRDADSDSWGLGWGLRGPWTVWSSDVPGDLLASLSLR